MSMRILSDGPRPAQRIVRVIPVAGRMCVDTGAVVIGRCHVPRQPVATRDGETLQEALLDPRTAAPRPLLQRVAGALWSWS